MFASEKVLVSWSLSMCKGGKKKKKKKKKKKVILPTLGVSILETKRDRKSRFVPFNISHRYLSACQFL